MRERIYWFSDTLEQNNGIATYLQEMMPLISSQKNCSVDLYCGRVTRDYSFPVHSLPYLSFPLFPSYDIVLPLLKKFDCDIVHAHTPYVLGWKAVKLEVPKVVTAHFLPFHFLEWAFGSKPPKMLEKLGWAYEDWFLNQFDLVICQTKVGRQYFHAKGLKKPVKVIPNGMNLSKFKQASAKRFYEHYGMKDFALFVGRVDASKRPEWIVDAAKRLPDKLFVIAGAGKMLEQLEKPKNVKFLGRMSRSDLLDCFKAASVVMMPSIVETEGLVVQEAMACGTPVVISDNEVLAEVVGKAGLVCRNSLELSQHVQSVMEDPALRKDLSEKCLEKVAERDINKSIEALLDLYQELL
ncbi:MAG: glycosyltransferase [Candidatus Micrarchaeota archaeon]